MGSPLGLSCIELGLHFFHHCLEIGVLFEVLFAHSHTDVLTVDLLIEEESVNAAGFVDLNDDWNGLAWDFTSFSCTVHVVKRTNLLLLQAANSANAFLLVNLFSQPVLILNSLVDSKFLHSLAKTTVLCVELCRLVEKFGLDGSLLDV